MLCTFSLKCFVWLNIIFTLGIVSCVDLSCTEIYTVNEDTRFIVLNPNATLLPFEKQPNVKGNYLFTSGERIKGDRVVVNHYDNMQFTKKENIEVQLKYPARGDNGVTITLVEIAVSLSAFDADSFFFDGGISQKHASILLSCDQTRDFAYEIFIYGY